MRILRQLSFLGLVGATTLAAVAVATPARAETVIILLDQSGSMIFEGIGAGTKRWDDTTGAAANWIGYYRDNGDTVNAITIWGFSDGVTRPIWPAADGAGCEGTLGDIRDGANNVIATTCVMDRANSPEYYDNLAREISANGVGGTYMGSIYATYPPPQGAWTNLADGMCEVLEKLDNLGGNKSIILESDGFENYSSGLCSGTTPDFDPNQALVPTAPDWGFPADSWTAKVLRAAVRYPDPLAQAIYVGGNTANPRVLTQAEYNNFFSSSSDLAWKVDVHYAVCKDPVDVTGDGVPDCGAFEYPDHWLNDLELMSLFSFDGSLPTSPDQGQSVLFPAGPTPFAASANSVSLTAVPLEPDDYVTIPFSELAVLQALTGGSTRSTYREVVKLEGVEFGRDHVFAADVDDSGCSDMADLNIIMQHDVYLKEAAEPNQLAIRADINRDGWVNVNDRNMLLSPAHWGEACINPPPHPEGGASCWNHQVDGWETDVDCGGDDCLPCADGGMCEVDEDCESSPCIDGICGGPSFPCTEATAIDLGAPGSSKVVPNNACLKVKNGLPSWWGVRKMMLQSQWGGTYPVPFAWKSDCTSSSGTGRFTGDWQSTTLDKTSKSCATLIQLQGGGGNVRLVYYGM